MYVRTKLLLLIFQATLDPGFDGIYLPSRIAAQLFNNVQGVRRDIQNPRRWVSLFNCRSNS